MDGYNTLKQHLIVGITTIILIGLSFQFTDASLAASFARVSFLLLFATMCIGPIVKLKSPKKGTPPLMHPWTWRGELGIWFTITAFMHFLVLAFDRPITSFIEVGGGGYALANLLGAIALFWALILSATSCSKAIRMLGFSSWKWVQSFAYLIFYLSSCHYIYFQFFSTYGDNPGPNWFGYVAMTMTLLVILLEFAAFFSVIKSQKRK
ncbi:MAG: sulfoxide reductase heme-binding subunit YedZ [Oceanicoccus sp.]|jgi:sulfoxide reductase heme-binding subunit YedZ